MLVDIVRIPVKQAAEMIGMPYLKLQKQLRRGQIPGFKVGWNWYMLPEVVSHLAEGKTRECRTNQQPSHT